MKSILRTTAFAVVMGLVVPEAIAQEVKITVVGPMSGSFASFWPQIEPAAKAAELVINGAGGINGRKVLIAFADDACEPKQAVSVANKIVQDKVDVVIGHFCSGTSIAASEVYNEAGVLMISGASVASQLTERKMPLVFRTVGRDDQQGALIAGHIATGKFGTKAALVHDKSAFGKGLADNVDRYMERRGLKPLFVDSITAGESDFSALVTKIMSQGVDVVFFGGYHREAGLFIRQARQSGYKGTFMSGDGLKTQEFWSIAGEAAEGTQFAFFPDARQNSEAKAALDALKTFNSAGEGFSLYIFAAIEAYAAAARRAGSIDPMKVAASLWENSVPTVVGNLKFNAKGDVDRNLYGLYRWSAGAYALSHSTTFGSN